MKCIGYSWRQALLVPLLAMTLAACSPSWQARMPGEHCLCWMTKH
jgi:hypothetical protein